MKLLLLCLILATLAGCTVRGGWPRFLRPGESWGWHAPQEKAKSEPPHVVSYAESPSELPALAAMAKKRDGTNYIGVYLGMIAERTGPNSVMMFSATSGECLKAISYDDFDAIFVRKTRPEYLPTVYPGK